MKQAGVKYMRILHMPVLIAEPGTLVYVKVLFTGGFSEYRDEDAPVIYDIEEERMLLKKGTVGHVFK
jgi:hypothetical protein